MGRDGGWVQNGPSGVGLRAGRGFWEMSLLVCTLSFGVYSFPVCISYPAFGEQVI